MAAIRAFTWCVALHLGALGGPALAQALRVDSITPSQGPAAGNTAVTILGAGFTPDTTVRVNRNAAAVRVLDASRLEVTTPPLGEGAFATALAAVRVSNAAGTTYAEYLYVPPAFDQIGIGDITTIAGVGNFVGEGRLATQAIVDARAIAFDLAGNLYLVDEPGGRVRRVGADGRVVTIAGTGVQGYSGDGGPAVDARFNFPAGVVVDGAGNVYVADAIGNHRIRRIDAATGIVTTVAGTGQAGYSGDGGPAALAQLSRPSSIARDAQGNLFISDAGNQRLRRIDTSGVITTIAGNGVAGFSGDGGPATQASINLNFDQVGGLALDSRGNVYVVDFRNRRIRRIGTDGRIATVAGGGSSAPADGIAATAVNLIFASVTVDAQDTVLFTDETRVWRLEANGTLTKVAGTGVRGLSPDGARALDGAMVPQQMAIAANGDIIVSETAAKRIRRIDRSTGLLGTVAGIGPASIGTGGSPALAAVFNDLGVIGLDGAGNILVARAGLTIRRIDAAGRITTLAGSGLQPISGFYFEGVSAASAGMSPVSVQADPQGVIHYSDFCSVRRIGIDGTIRTIVGPTDRNQVCGFAGDGGPGTGALLAAEQDTIKIDAQGNIFIADLFNHRVRRLDAATGIINTFAGSGRATNTDGYDPGFVGPVLAGDGGPANQALLSSPSDVAFDSRRNVCIADQGSFTVRCVDSQGIIRTVAGGGSMYPGDGSPGTAVGLGPYRIAFDRAGNLYITDYGDGSIRKLDVNGIISTVGGVHGSRGFSGDGGPAVQARIDYGSGLAVDAQGNILFFDGENRRIRVIKQAPTLGSAPGANVPGPLSGLWWNPNESGWGVNFTQRNNVVFSAWYTYDAAGNPKWYVAPRCVLPSSAAGGGCSETLYEVSGPRFFSTAFDPAAVRANPAGTLQLNFAGAASGSMTYTVAGQSRTVAIARQEFAPSAALPVNYTDLWWNPAESGWGIAITQQGGVMFLAWYVYDGSGRPVWIVAPDCRVNVAQNGCSGPLFRTTGPPLGPTFDPSAVRASSAGSVSVTFPDPNNGTLSYTVDGVSGSKAITRQLF